MEHVEYKGKNLFSFEGVKFYPGVNEVSREVYDKMIVSKSVLGRVKMGIIKMMPLSVKQDLKLEKPMEKLAEKTTPELLSEDEVLEEKKKKK